MTNIEITKQYVSKELKQVWGGSRVFVTYAVETIHEGHRKNQYEVTCTVRGLETGDPEMQVTKVVAFTNNEDTLIAEALSERLGWQCADIETEMAEVA